jgi:hypothetical protein
LHFLQQLLCNDAQPLSEQEIYLNSTLAAIANNATALDTASATLKTSVTNVYTNVFGSLSTTLQPLFNTVAQFTNAARCGFIGAGYFSIKIAMCSSMLGSLSTIALCSFFIGIANFAVIVAATVLAKRMPNARAEDAELVMELGALAEPDSYALMSPLRSIVRGEWMVVGASVMILIF